MGPEELENLGLMLSDSQMEVLHAYLQGYRDRINRLEGRITDAMLVIQFMRRRYAECTDTVNQLITLWEKLEDRITHLERKDDVV